MKKIILLFFCIACFLFASCEQEVKKGTAPEKKGNWILTWSDEFNGNELDYSKWGKITRQSSDWNSWNKYMTNQAGCYGLKDGHLIVRGIVNTDPKTDKAPYLTGGVWTKNKVSFAVADARLEIRAKIQNAKGAWPAIWMVPVRRGTWPDGGEIDMMEHLNSDPIIYSTVHSNYTEKDGIKDNPKSGSTHSIKPNDYNVYAVEFYRDSLSFYVNDSHTFTYPRIETDKKDQFPFFARKDFYLMLDMQLGGSWVGSINPQNLPVEMDVDWVRYYKKNSSF